MKFLYLELSIKKNRLNIHQYHFLLLQITFNMAMNIVHKSHYNAIVITFIPTIIVIF